MCVGLNKHNPTSSRRPSSSLIRRCRRSSSVALTLQTMHSPRPSPAPVRRQTEFGEARGASLRERGPPMGQRRDARARGATARQGAAGTGAKALGPPGGSVMGYLVAIVIVAGLLLWNGIKIVREYQRLVVFRLGRSIGQL